MAQLLDATGIFPKSRGTGPTSYRLSENASRNVLG